jgi:hypothetical protein
MRDCRPNYLVGVFVEMGRSHLHEDNESGLMPDSVTTL